MIVINVILIYWVSFKGIVEENITSLFSLFSQCGIQSHSTTVTEPLASNSGHVAEKTKSDLLTSDEMTEIVKTADDYIKNWQCYVKDDLTIIDVSKAINVHPKRISNSLNKQKGENFNSYINKFRVEKAKALFKDISLENLSVEALAWKRAFTRKLPFTMLLKSLKEILRQTIENEKDRHMNCHVDSMGFLPRYFEKSCLNRLVICEMEWLLCFNNLSTVFKHIWISPSTNKEIANGFNSIQRMIAP